jgi:hypothetical protein
MFHRGRDPLVEGGRLDQRPDRIGCAKHGKLVELHGEARNLRCDRLQRVQRAAGAADFRNDRSKQPRIAHSVPPGPSPFASISR